MLKKCAASKYRLCSEYPSSTPHPITLQKVITLYQVALYCNPLNINTGMRGMHWNIFNIYLWLENFKKSV